MRIVVTRTAMPGAAGRTRHRAMIPAAILVLAMAGCGTDPAPRPVPTPTASPAPANAAPVFSSASVATIGENRIGAAYQAAAWDADGDALLFAIQGGVDAALFTITPAGAVAFRSVPDFEAPKDADADNIYELTLSVSDGKAIATLPVRIIVANQRIRVRRLADDFVEPSRVLPVPDGSGRVYVVERRGVVWIYDPSTGKRADTPFLDVRDQVSTDGERGLLNLLVTPLRNRLNLPAAVLVNVYLTNSAGDIELRRYFTLSPTDFERADPASRTISLRVPHPGNRSNGGGLNIYAVGLQGGPILIVGIGDADEGPSQAQDPTSLLGKLVYGVPTDDNFNEPLVITAARLGTAPRIGAFGLKDPRDISSGILVDRGPAIQELNVATIANFGWPVFEGTNAYPGSLFSRLSTHRRPILQYTATTENVRGSAIAGSLSYTGNIEDLAGQVLFGDANGSIWSLPVSTFSVTDTTTLPLPTTLARPWTGPFTPDRGTLAGLTSMAQAADGRIYLTTAGGGLYVAEIADP